MKNHSVKSCREINYTMSPLCSLYLSFLRFLAVFLERDWLYGYVIFALGLWKMAQNLLILYSLETQSCLPSLKTYKLQMYGISEKLGERITPQNFSSQVENMIFSDLTSNCGLLHWKDNEIVSPGNFFWIKRCIELLKQQLLFYWLAWVCKLLSEGQTQTCLFIYVSSVAAFKTQCHSWVVVTETAGPQSQKYLPSALHRTDLPTKGYV